MSHVNKEPKSEDLTGQSRFAWNLMVSWASQLILIFSGFVMPRLVDQKVGQDLLGIWDFGWSFVSYLTLVGLGMGACFNRYIAMHRAANEIMELNKVANSVIFVQIIIAFLVVSTTIIFYFCLPYYFSESLLENTQTAQRVILFLGLSLSIQMLAGSARGLLTGYHRWDIHNVLHAGASILSLALMMVALYFTNLSIEGMAIGYFISTLFFESLRFYYVKKICKEFTFNINLANLSTCKRMLKFGIKSMLSNVPPIILLQTISLLLVSSIGPAALAVFARPMALTKHIKTFMAKFTLMLTPTAGAMQGANESSDLQALFINTTKLSFTFCIPALGGLFIYGDQILALWMGGDYATKELMMILSAGLILSMGQDSSIRILMGMNKHGKISVIALISLMLIFLIGLSFTGIDRLALSTAGLLFVIPMTLVYGILLPVYTCIQLKLSYFSYCRKSILIPILYSLPFFLLMFYSRFLFDQSEHFSALLSAVSAGFITAIIYFIYLLPLKMKKKCMQACKLIKLHNKVDS
ncbi:MATE family efflux transporter [Psychromonas sp. SP041]|uniref:lipopolysaccharide biosynthesis protein n=1 Tax=Psychromonas sp. SP041 TaxID=1365007 RepID=UPI0010C7D333|nr:MATE family efflux transporter [Psychromonas sp. SP041]